MIPECCRLQNILPLQDGIDSGVDDGNLCLWIFLQNKGLCVESGLHGTAEFCGDTDADHRRAGLGKGQESLLIILNGRHGGLGVYALFLYHLLIEVTDADLYIFLKIMCIVEGYVKRYYGDVLFLYKICRQIAGTVADNMKCFCHVLKPSLLAG